MTALWPVHPAPLPDETLSSWLTRVARGNGSSLSSWLPLVGRRYGEVLSLDTSENPEFWRLLARCGALTGGVEAVRSMTMLDIERRLEPHAASRWMLSIDNRVSRPKHGFCVACLASDPIPYLRRAWRLEWVRWCPMHECRLEWSCRGCGTPLAPWGTPWTRPFAACWGCGRDIVRCDPTHELASVKAPRFVLDAQRQALAVLRDIEQESPFGAVWSAQKWAELVGQECWPAWVTKLGLGTPHEATPPSQEDAPAWSFAVAWSLVTGPRARLAEFAVRHQASFNRATTFRCPPALRALRRPVFVARKITPEDVEEVIESLVRGDMPVTYLAVAEALSVDPKRIGGTPTLRALIDRTVPVALRRWCANMRELLSTSRDRLQRKGVRLSRLKLAEDAEVSLEAIARYERETGETFALSPCETYEELVRDAIITLRENGQRITTVAVCRHLQRDRSFIEKSPDLKRLIEVAREAKPTVDTVRDACEAIRQSAHGVVTTLGVAKQLRCGRHIIERSETLRAIVKEQRVFQRKETEQKILTAVATLNGRGDAVTMIAVCRLLGVGRTFVEKRGRLRAIVLRARSGV